MTRSWIHWTLILSLATNLLVAMMMIVIVHSKGGLPWIHREVARWKESRYGGPPALTRYAHDRVQLFEQLGVTAADTVFLGDSNLDHGEWQELMHDPHAVNRAIDGDDTADVLRRLEPIVSGHPAHVVLLCGINSLHHGVALARIQDEYAQIVERLTASGRTDVWLVPVLPVNADLYRQWIVPGRAGIRQPPQDEVRRLDAFIGTLVQRDPQRIHFVTMGALLDGQGQLSAAYTSDGLHLNAAGLVQLAAALHQAMQAVDRPAS